MSTLLEQYDHAMAEFDSRVTQIRDDQWSDPTPCTDWDVRALVAHLVDECRWVPYLIDGGTVAGPGTASRPTRWVTTPRRPGPGVRGGSRVGGGRRARWTTPSPCRTARSARVTTSGS